MAARLRTPEVLTSARDVSPLGASRFEKPLTAATPRASSSTSPSTDIVDDPSSPFSKPSDASTHSPPSTVNEGPLHHRKPSLPPAPIIVPPGAGTAQQPPSSPVDACPLPSDRESWFMRQAAEEDYLPVEKGDECPDRATLAAVREIPVYDSDGNAMPFGSLYEPETATHQRQLIIFVRWFYCGACQAFVKALTNGITMEDYFRIPTPTSIVIISCGQPDLIPQYRKLTDNCPFTILTDPTRELFKKLGMKWTLDLGNKRPDYLRDKSVMDVVKGQVKDVSGAIRDPDGIRKRDLFRGGNMLQIGGEFLFEEGEVIWCHRMRNMRGHAEIDMLRKLLELDPR